MFSACIGAANARAGLLTRNIPLKSKISSCQAWATTRSHDKVNKSAFGFHETNHIQIHPEVSIMDGTYFNLVLLPTKGQ